MNAKTPFILTDSWDVSDVQNRLEDMHNDFYESIPEEKLYEFSKEVLLIMQAQYDANIGYNWDSMDSAIQQAISEGN